MNKGTSVYKNLKTIENLTQAGVNVLAMLVVGFSDLDTELNNCASIVSTIEHFSRQKFCDGNGKQMALPIQWRPAPMFLVPSSFDYNEKVKTDTWSWKSKFRTDQSERKIANLEAELMEIPYTFKRPIPDEEIITLLKEIQEADRKAGFTIGGVMKYVIDYTMKMRR